MTAIFFGGDFLKKKVSLFLAVVFCMVFVLSSCGDPINALENFCFKIKDFDLEAAYAYVNDGADGYFERVLGYEQKLSERQLEIAKELYSHVGFTDITETDGVYSVTVKYIDFSALINDVNISLAMGMGNASDHISDIISSGRLKTQFIRTEKNVPVAITEIDGEAKLVLGYSSENKRFTELLGLEAFLGWYSTKR